MASMAMAHREQEICSPVDRSISISRLEPLGLISAGLGDEVVGGVPLGGEHRHHLWPRR